MESLSLSTCSRLTINDSTSYLSKIKLSWFEIAIVSIIYALGNILFGRFEERAPKWKRVGQYLLTVVIIILVSDFFGRTVVISVLAVFLLPVLYVHGYYLPKKKSINGWTGEPKSKYYDSRKWDKNIFKEI